MPELSETGIDLDELDGPVASPEHHAVIFENDRVRVLQTSIPRGETTAVHTHRRPTALHVISGEHFLRRHDNGEVALDTRLQDPPFEMPTILWMEDVGAHTIENVGATDLLVIGVEIKS